MKKKDIRLVWVSQGILDAQMKKNYLNSFGIDVFLFEESIGSLYGLTYTPLGEVELYVSSSDFENAEELLTHLEYHEKDE